jgi:hypothetical protein
MLPLRPIQELARLFAELEPDARFTDILVI